MWRICAAVLAMTSIAVAGCKTTGTVGHTAGTVEIEPTDLSLVEVGTERKTVEQALGEPIDIYVAQGVTVAVYQYDRGGIRGYSISAIESAVYDPVDMMVLPFAISLAHAIAQPIETYKLRKTQRAWLCVTYLDGQSVAEMKRILDEKNLPDCEPPENIPASPLHGPP
jgi:hypothetical protein